uniref:Si:dkey-32n7.7 n=1 Tax=Oryzias latipes TaxID=8090 RepID=A0A3P9JC92_ORYLA
MDCLIFLCFSVRHCSPQFKNCWGGRCCARKLALAGQSAVFQQAFLWWLTLTLINKEWKLLVSLGRQNLEGKNPNEVSRHVAAIIGHPDFDRGTMNNDIALVRLSSPVTFSHYIRPVCLAASASVFNNGTGSWVTGWGYLLPFPQTVQECNCLYGVINITSNMICAGCLDGGKDSCQEDSGGPMVTKQGSVWIPSGIVSFGIGCARPNLPGVYSRVSRNQTWIKSHISSHEPGFVQFPSMEPDPDSNYTCPGLPTATALPGILACHLPVLSTLKSDWQRWYVLFSPVFP